MFFLITVIVIYSVPGVIFGLITNSIIADKGYDDNWFWWGFFFNFVAILVALSRPEVTTTSSNYSQNLLLKNTEKERTLNNGEWKCCFCNSINEFYVTTCACGKNKEETERQIKRNKEKEVSKTSADTLVERETKTIELIKQYKNLLDSGAITQEEFEAKKQSLLTQNHN